MREDSQKQKVYDWQYAIYDSVEHILPDIFVELPLEICQRFANKICRSYRLDPPKVVRHRNKNGAYAFYTHHKSSITLPDNWARCAVNIAHESAHAVTRGLYGISVPAHGAEFVRIYADIMAKFLGIDPMVIERFIEVAKIEAMPTSPVPGVFQCR